MAGSEMSNVSHIQCGDSDDESPSAPGCSAAGEVAINPVGFDLKPVPNLNPNPNPNRN